MTVNYKKNGGFDIMTKMSTMTMTIMTMTIMFVMLLVYVMLKGQ